MCGSVLMQSCLYTLHEYFKQNWVMNGTLHYLSRVAVQILVCCLFSSLTPLITYSNSVVVLVLEGNTQSWYLLSKYTNYINSVMIVFHFMQVHIICRKNYFLPFLSPIFTYSSFVWSLSICCTVALSLSLSCISNRKQIPLLYFYADQILFYTYC